MRTRALVAAALVAAFVATPPAEAKHRRPLKGSYDVRIPVPFPGEAASGSHCEEAPDGVSRNMKTLTLPSSGKLKVTLTEWVGDWVVELFDSKNNFLTSAGALSTGDTSISLNYRKKTRTSQKVTIGICNFAGGPDGHVDWTFTFD